MFLFFFILFFSEAFSQRKSEIKHLKSRLEKSKTNRESVSILLSLSEEFFKQEEFDSVISISENISKFDLKISENVSANVLLGIAKINVGVYRSGIEILEKVLPYLEKKKDARRARVYSFIGRAYVGLNELETALAYLKNAEKIAKGEDELFVFIYLSIIYSKSYNDEKSLYYLNKAINLSFKDGDKGQLANIYSRYANLSSSREEYKEALTYYNLAKEIYNSTNANFNLAVTENNIAEIYVSIDSIDLAKYHYNKALEYSVKNNYSYLSVIIQSNIIKQEIKQGFNLEKSIDSLVKINNTYLNKNMKELICENENSIAQAYLKKEDTLKAIKHLKRSILIAKEKEFYHLNEDNVKLLALINYNRQKYKEAYLNIEEVIQLRRKVLDVDKNREVERLKIKFKVNQKENEFKIKEQELNLIKEKKKKKVYLYFVIGLLLLSAIVILIKQNHFVKEKKKLLFTENSILSLKKELLKKEVETKNMQLTYLAIDIEEKDTLFKTLKNKIKKIRRQVTDESVSKELQTLFIVLNNYSQRNRDRIQIILEADIKDTEFYNCLKLKHSDLTDREIRIIGYLRLNICSKQIANALSISELSVNNIRSKIRKKLKIDRNEDFSSFFKNYY